MCGLAGVTMEHATRALLRADVVLAEQVIGDHKQIAAMSTAAEDTAFKLLALRAPVAEDLRAVVSAVRVAADVERMGALAMHVAKVVRRRHPQHVFPEQVNGYFAEMGRVAVELDNAAQEARVTGDPDEAARVDDEDDAAGEHRHLGDELATVNPLVDGGQRNLGLTSDSSQFVCHRIECAQRVEQHLRVLRVRLGG
jgi:phosphate transport system protein